MAIMIEPLKILIELANQLKSEKVYSGFFIKIARTILRGYHDHDVKIDNSLGAILVHWNLVVKDTHLEWADPNTIIQMIPPPADDRLSIDCRAHVLSCVARAYQDRGELARAKRFYLKGLALARKSQGKEGPLTREIFVDFISNELLSGESEKADELYKTVIRLENEIQVFDESSLKAFEEHGQTLLSVGDFLEARISLERAWIISRDLYGRAHPHTANCLNNFAFALYKLRDLNKSENLFHDAIKLWQDCFGSKSVYLAFAYNNIGIIRIALGDYTTAIYHIEQALDIWRYDGSNVFYEALALHNSATCEFYLKNLTKSDTLIREAISLRVGTVGREHRVTAASYLLQAKILMSMTQEESAALIANSAKEIYEDPSVYETLAEDDLVLLAEVYCICGLYEKAMSLIEDQTDESMLKYGDSNYRIARLQELLASCHIALGDTGKAENTLRLAKRIYTESGAPLKAIEMNQKIRGW